MYGSDFVSVVEAAVLKLCIIIDNKCVASRKFIKEAKPRNVLRLVNEDNQFFLLNKKLKVFLAGSDYLACGV